jgi:hypothetical protein
VLRQAVKRYTVRVQYALGVVRGLATGRGPPSRLPRLGAVSSAWRRTTGILSCLMETPGRARAKIPCRHHRPGRLHCQSHPPSRICHPRNNTTTAVTLAQAMTVQTIARPRVDQSRETQHPMLARRTPWPRRCQRARWPRALPPPFFPSRCEPRAMCIAMTQFDDILDEPTASGKRE